MKITEKEAKKELLYWSKRLYDKGFSPATSGNISIKINDKILISASGTCLGDITESDVAKTDLSGLALKGSKKPSSEKVMHAKIYSKRNDINAIIHSHCPIITSFAVAGFELNKPILPDFALLFSKVPICPYYCPSSIELAEVCSDLFKEGNNAVLLKNHGVIIGANNLKNAYYLLETLKMYCEIYLNAHTLGGIKTLTKKNVQEIEKLYKK